MIDPKKYTDTDLDRAIEEYYNDYKEIIEIFNKSTEAMSEFQKVLDSLIAEKSIRNSRKVHQEP